MDAEANGLLSELNGQLRQGWAESLVPLREWFGRTQKAPLSMGRVASVESGVAAARAFLRCFFTAQANWAASSNLSGMAVVPCSSSEMTMARFLRTHGRVI